MFKFKKIASVLASTVMLTSTLALAVATTFPAPFVQGATADAAMVVGSNPIVASLGIDILASNAIANKLAESVPGGGTPSGDYVQISKASDNLNLGDTWTKVYTGNVDKDDLSDLLADGTYVADDNDEFTYEQKISLGNPGLQQFRDSDYESLVGLSEKTPVVGFKLPSNTWVLNYTLDFRTDAESDISGTDLEDFEGSDIMLLGKNYYISDAKLQAASTNLGKFTLLDAANSGIVNEGETITLAVGDTSYEVSISYLSTTETKLTVNGETTNSVAEGASYKLNDGSYLGIKDIAQRDVAGVIGNVEFSIGSGKLEITSGSDIKLNDETITGVKGWIIAGTTNSSSTNKIDKIVIEWKTSDEEFLTPQAELLMPGFKAVKFTMNELVRSEEEKITIEGDGDTSIKLTAPIKDGKISINLLYANESGEFIGIGKSATERLLTVAPNVTSINFYEQFNSAEYHEYFVASYNISSQGESYLLRAKISADVTNGRNETTISKYTDTGWSEVCKEKTIGDTCSMGLVSFTVTDVNYTTGGANRTATFTADTNVNFQTLYTDGGLQIYLPFATDNSSMVFTRPGEINVTRNATNGGVETVNMPLGAIGGHSGAWTHASEAAALKVGGPTGHDPLSFWLFMDPEDKDDKIGDGPAFNLTIDDESDGDLEVSQVNNVASGGFFEEVGSGSGIYQMYVNASDVAPRILRYSKGDPDYAEVYYPSGDSETYAEVFLTEAGASTGGSTPEQAGILTVKDTEISQVSGKNLVVVGGSCVNSLAASLVGVSANTCEAGWTAATGVGNGQYLIQTFDQGDGTVATVVAGYSAGDTTNAATYFRTQSVDTTAGKKYIGTTATSATLQTA